MKTIDRQTAAQRMAQWLATGGAIEAAAHPESGRDDGLAANGLTLTAYRNCYTDDGLQATAFTAPGSLTCSMGDDGLQALVPSMRIICNVDDGLTAGYTSQWCKIDDGLTACEPSFSRMCFVDDGLTAGGYSTSFCPVMAPERAPAR